MPIKFRCPHCRQFLGISRSKAGEISDCPMCGKTVRVPNLDGTVNPLPKPQMNLEDSSLVDALGELAGIGADDETIDSGADRSAEGFSRPAAHSAPAPVTLEPLAPAKPVAVAEVRRSGPRPFNVEVRSASTRDNERLDSEDASLDELASQAEQSTSSRTPVAPRAIPWIPIAIVAGVLMAAGAGWAVLKRSPTTSEQSQSVSPESVAKVAPTPETADEVAIRGRITYISEAGDTRPDDGARVIVLPMERGGTVKFDVAGFMVGAGEVDAAVAAASLRALGGDLATTGSEGEYTITLPNAGQYRMIVISRHQSRPWEVGVESDVLELLDRFYFRPSMLLGQLAYEVQEFRYRGHGTSPRDFAFSRD